MGTAGLLDDVHDVDWSALRHAYGPASDVPGLLTTIAEGDNLGRDKAITDLFGAICHQGTVYEATAPAVPFIARLARDAEMTDDQRRRIVALLGYIAAGRGYLQVHGTFLRSATTIPIDDVALAREPNDVAAARQAVAREFPSLLGRLGGTNGRMDWNLAFTASQVAESAGAAVGLLDSLAAGSDDPQLRAALALTRVLVSDEAGTEAAEVWVAALREEDREQADADRVGNPARWPRTVAELLFEEGFEQDPVR
jgi:hypothetical protein